MIILILTLKKIKWVQDRDTVEYFNALKQSMENDILWVNQRFKPMNTWLMNVMTVMFYL